MDRTNQTVVSPGTKDDGCALFQLSLYSAVLGFMCLVGFAGNIASICVLQKDRTSATATFLLRALAVADTAFLALWTLHYSVRYVVNYLGIGDRAVWLYVRVCSFPCLYITQTLTIWLMVVVACNRLIVVCMPCRAHRLCCLRNFQLTVGLLVLGAVLSNAPRFFEIQLMQNETSGATTWRKTDFALSDVYRIIYTDIVYYLLTFVLPLMVIAFANIRVIGAYRAARRLQDQQHQANEGSMNENAITLVMIVIVAIFVMCQAPSRVVQMTWGYRYNHCREPRFYLIHISNSLEVFNSSVNFFVYVVFYKRFRFLLKRSLCCGPLAERILGRDLTATTEGLYLEEKCWEPTPDDQQQPRTTAEAAPVDTHERMLVDARSDLENVLEASSNDEHVRLNADIKTPYKAIVLCE